MRKEFTITGYSTGNATRVDTTFCTYAYSSFDAINELMKIYPEMIITYIHSEKAPLEINFREESIPENL